MKSFCPYGQCSPLTILTFFPLKVDAQKGFRCVPIFLKTLPHPQFFVVPPMYPSFPTLPHLQAILLIVLILTPFKIVRPLLPGNVSSPIFFKRVSKACFHRMSLSQCFFSIGLIEVIEVATKCILITGKA